MHRWVFGAGCAVHRFRTIEEAVQRERRRGHATLAQLRATSRSANEATTNAPKRETTTRSDSGTPESPLVKLTPDARPFI